MNDARDRWARRNFQLKMPGRVISVESYERGVARLAVEFERRVQRVDVRIKDGPLSQWCILNALRNLGRPVTYREVAAELGCENTIRNLWLVSSRLWVLARQGQARRVGRMDRRMAGHFGGHADVTFHPWLYEYVQPCTTKRERRAREWLDHEMDKLDAGRALRMCVMSAHSFAGSDRNQRIIAAHVQGKNKSDIARDLGLSRERVRQIIAAAIRRRQSISPDA